MRRLFAALLLCLAWAVQPAFAAFDRHAVNGQFSAEPSHPTVRHVRHVQRASRRVPRPAHHRETARPAAVADTSPQILPHPAGCPARAFCGCGAAVEVFGRPIRELWLAANWLRFPPAAPAPGMVAVRRHHVFVIREVKGPGLVLAYDANSGGRRTRLHLRSLAGYSVRDPRGGRHYAVLQ